MTADYACSHRHCVEQRELGVAPNSGARIGAGGNSDLAIRVYDGERYLYKLYHQEHAGLLDAAALDGLISWRLGLSEVDRQFLDETAAWPRRVVCDGTNVRGVLIPMAPRRFFKRTAENILEPLQLSMFMDVVSDGQRMLGPTPPTRRRALGHAILIVLWLHERRVIVNDVHLENILCARDGSAAYFVDCDSMIGGWGEAFPPGAPEYMRDVVPDADDPSYATDLARMCWTVRWIMLSEIFAGMNADLRRRLVEVTDPDAEQLLASCATAGRDSTVPVAELSRLAQKWVKINNIFGDRPMSIAETTRADSAAEAVPAPEPAPAPEPHRVVGGPFIGKAQTGRPKVRPIRPSARSVARRPGEWIPADLRMSLTTMRLELWQDIGHLPSSASARLPKWLLPLILFTLLVALLAIAMAGYRMFGADAGEGGIFR